jgi:class 3 adenylate cyclase/pimeloyl-ACP methyl ester carboxylesterase
VRYATSPDGVRIAYTVVGTGEPVFLSAPLTFSHQSLERRIPALAEFYDRIAADRTLVRWDPRRYGLSQRGVEREASFIDTQADDLLCVADDLGLERFDVVAINATVGIAVAAAEPTRVRSLLLAGTLIRVAELLDDPDQAAVRSLAEQNWDVYVQTLAGFLQGWAPNPDFPYADFIRESIDQADYLQQLQAWRTIDVTDRLGRIDCPTTVLTTAEASDIGRRQSIESAAGIPGATLQEIPGAATPLNPAGGEAILEFLGATSGPVGAAPSAFRTVLFTDVVGHTAMMHRLGDDQGRSVLRDHERIIRAALEAHRGTEVKSMGDGFMAAFGSVTAAVDCAVSLQRRLAEHNATVDEPLGVRVGLNAGEPIAEDDDLFGSTVILAARIAACADGGEILVPEAVRHLLAGKPYRFHDHGENVLKGFDEPMHLYRVDWAHSGT